MNVLIVDDIGFSRYRYTQALIAAGHSAQSAANGQEALNILTKDTLIDIVVTDDAMPDMDGIELFRRSRELERLDDSGRNLQPDFILMTMPASGSSAARGARSISQNALDLGFAAVLVKPVSTAVLAGQLQTVGKSRGERGPRAEATPSNASARAVPPKVPGTPSAEPAAAAFAAAAGLRVDGPGAGMGPEGIDGREPREVALEMRRLAELLVASMPGGTAISAG